MRKMFIVKLMNEERAEFARVAMRLIRKLELVPTPKHGSWLNVAEPELSVLTRQCLSDRIGSQQVVLDRSTAWAADRNTKQIGVDWTFTTEDARRKLVRLYPKIKT